jgi:hypothetical protein
VKSTEPTNGGLVAIPANQSRNPTVWWRFPMEPRSGTTKTRDPWAQTRATHGQVTRDPWGPDPPWSVAGTEIRRWRSFGETQGLEPATREPRKSEDPWPALPEKKTRFFKVIPATFPAELVAFFGGFAMKILGVISYNLWWFIWGLIWLLLN